MLTGMTNEETVEIGARIESDGHYATVRFVGYVPPTSGIWIGVEWDDPSRGKHDGCYEGVRYFSTEHPTAGSFLRLKKCNRGVPFMTALVEKYGRVEDENELVRPEEMFVLGTNKKTHVELVGARKLNIEQSQFCKLKEVSLNGMYVSGAGNIGDIACNLPNIRELQLSVSLISSWSQVIEIVSQMPLLEQLDVSLNRLQLPNVEDSQENVRVPVEALYANRMNVDWQDVNKFIVLFKSLLEFHICYNRITLLENCSVNMEHLILLNLEGNPIREWSNVLCLTDLKHLETLILNGTDLGEIVFPDENHPTVHFPKLVSLSLSDNRISEWSSVNELNKLQSLTMLRFHRNPLVEKAGGTLEARQVIIAKMSRIKMLNRMEVTAGERRGAELDYIKLYGLEWKNAGGGMDPTKLSSSFMEAHPRYVELIKKLGSAEDSEMKKIESTALKNSLIRVKFRNPLLGDSPDLEKKLPLTMTIQKLRALIQRMFKLPDQGIIRLSYVSQKMIGPEIDLDNNQRDLSFYSVEDGDTICVHC